MLDYSSTGPEDMDPDEEDMHGYVCRMPDDACTGFADTVSYSVTLPRALRPGTPTRRAYTIMLASSPIYPAWVL